MHNFTSRALKCFVPNCCHQTHTHTHTAGALAGAAEGAKQRDRNSLLLLFEAVLFLKIVQGGSTGCPWLAESPTAAAKIGSCSIINSSASRRGEEERRRGGGTFALSFSVLLFLKSSFSTAVLFVSSKAQHSYCRVWVGCGRANACTHECGSRGCRILCTTCCPYLRSWL